MSRGCLLYRPCGCSTLDGRPYKKCDRHAAEGGTLAPVPAIDAWLEKHQAFGSWPSKKERHYDA